MEIQVKLPVVNENGYYEIRLESIGGLGANLCGKMLGELGALYMGLNAASFSSYGSEKRGSPVKAFIRYSDADVEINSNSPVEKPHILCLFHEAMIGKSEVASGVTKNTKIVVNTDQTAERIFERLQISEGTVYVVDAQKIAMEVKSRINMVMLGAVAGVSGFIPEEAVLALADKTVGKKYPEMLEANLSGIRRGYCEVFGDFFCREKEEESREDVRKTKNGQSDRKISEKKEKIHENEWGYENAPIGGVNPCFGSTVSNDLSASREGYLPLFIKERCINCGLCDTTCPDMVFQFEQGTYMGKRMMVNKGLDYHHCKGCLRCVEICPVNALVRGEERNHPNPEYAMRNKDLKPNYLEYEKVGANSWVTAESHLTEKRVDGGLL